MKAMNGFLNFCTKIFRRKFVSSKINFEKNRCRQDEPLNFESGHIFDSADSPLSKIWKTYLLSSYNPQLSGIINSRYIQSYIHLRLPRIRK